MAVYEIGDTFTNGFFVISTPTTLGNNTGDYLVSNTLGFQYYVTGATIDTYDLVGNNNGSAGSTSSNSGGSTTTVYVDIAEPDGSPFTYLPAGTASGSTLVVSTVSGSMVRLVNLSDLGQAAMIVGYDNASATSGRILFAQQLDVQQIVDINVRTYHGITLAILGSPINSDFGVNIVNDTGGAADLTGYPFTPIPPSTSTPVVVYAGACSFVGLRNNSANDQPVTFVGYDNASTTSGRILFRQQLSAGQCPNIKETAYYGITVAVVGGSSNSDYGVNVLYAPTVS